MQVKRKVRVDVRGFTGEMERKQAKKERDQTIEVCLMGHLSRHENKYDWKLSQHNHFSTKLVSGFPGKRRKGL